MSRRNKKSKQVDKSQSGAPKKVVADVKADVKNDVKVEAKVKTKVVKKVVKKVLKADLIKEVEILTSKFDVAKKRISDLETEAKKKGDSVFVQTKEAKARESKASILITKLTDEVKSLKEGLTEKDEELTEVSSLLQEAKLNLVNLEEDSEYSVADWRNTAYLFLATTVIGAGTAIYAIFFR